MDQQIAEERDKKRYRLKEKRTTTITSLFGDIQLERNYYKDQEKGEYVYLLDRYLEFEGGGSLSPMVEETALEMAISGPSYRKAADMLETLLGYRVISHETIRQHLLQISTIPKDRQPVDGSVLFVEVDGLYIKRQGKGKLVINGDGAGWITACREYFKGRAFFSIDRFHVAHDFAVYAGNILAIAKCGRH
ncbi:UPF0236 family transposase-like protein [Calidifontibacillus erzurumensis]|uniref:UPF0236 family transposase-like protein n=1 Tax=Calidifontibacillus erzurumensis TaxID=2741433 RepID=UPI0035B559C2